MNPQHPSDCTTGDNEPHKNRDRTSEDKTGRPSGHEDEPERRGFGSSTQKLEHTRQRLAFLCHDLRTFTSNPDAARRLTTSVYPHFIGPPYLTEEDAQIVLSYDVCMLRSASRAALLDESAISAEGSKTLTTFLEDGVADLVAARKAKGNNDDQRAERDFVLCTSHDLAPLLQEACGFTKGYFETRAFRDGYRRWGKEVRKANKKTKGLDRND